VPTLLGDAPLQDQVLAMVRGQVTDIISGTIFVFLGLAACGTPPEKSTNSVPSKISTCKARFTMASGERERMCASSRCGNYLIRIFDKLGISSRVELVLYAFSGTEGNQLQRTREHIPLQREPLVRKSNSRFM